MRPNRPRRRPRAASAGTAAAGPRRETARTRCTTTPAGRTVATLCFAWCPPLARDCGLARLDHAGRYRRLNGPCCGAARRSGFDVRRAPAAGETPEIEHKADAGNDKEIPAVAQIAQTAEARTADPRHGGDRRQIADQPPRAAKLPAEIAPADACLVVNVYRQRDDDEQDDLPRERPFRPVQ